MSWRFRVRRQWVFLRHLFWEAYRERILLSIVATIVFASLITILNNVYYGHVIWERFYTQSDIDHFFCEYTDMNKLIRQPVNTVTNFVYFVIAIYCFSKGMEDIKKKRAYNLITANRFYSFTLSAIMLYTFIGSTLFHSSLIDFFSKMDFSAVYSITLFPAMYFTHRFILTIANQPTNIRRYKDRLALIAIFSMLYLLLAFGLNKDDVVPPLVAGIILATIGMVIYLERVAPGRSHTNDLIVCIASILIAGALFVMDIFKIFCSDIGRISPHSLWHIFNGLSIFFFYLYIRSENYDYTHDELRRKLKEKAHNRVQSKMGIKSID